MKKLICLLLPAFFLFTVLCPQASFQAACSGLILWSQSLVPSLFPVMILSGLLLRTGVAYRIASLAAPPFRFLGISPYGVYAILTGFLCGCPMGAKTLADMRRQQKISRREAVYLISFCNNLGPAFLTNYLVHKHLQAPERMAPTLIILYGAPILFGLFSNLRYQTEKGLSVSVSKNKTSPTSISLDVVDACISDSIINITKLGSYVILFSMVSAVIESLPLSNSFLKAGLAGFMEVSNGIHMISQLPVPFRIKYLLLIACVSLSGLCCMAQSYQMLKEIGISGKKYLSDRIAVTAIALIMALCYLM